MGVADFTPSVEQFNYLKPVLKNMGYDLIECLEEYGRKRHLQVLNGNGRTLLVISIDERSCPSVRESIEGVVEILSVFMYIVQTPMESLPLIMYGREAQDFPLLVKLRLSGMLESSSDSIYDECYDSLDLRSYIESNKRENNRSSGGYLS